MNRIGYYVFRWYAVAIKLISQKGYDKWIVRARKKVCHFYWKSGIH